MGESEWVASDNQSGSVRSGERITMKRTKHGITYHRRRGHPVIHTAKSGRRYIMVRRTGGGTKRLYEGSRYYTGQEWRRLRL